MVEGDAALDPAVLVQHVSVQPAVHALAWPAGAEGAAAAEQRLQGCEGVDVGGGDREGFEGEVDVGEAGEGRVGWRRDWREGEEAAGIVRGLGEDGGRE